VLVSQGRFGSDIMVDAFVGEPLVTIDWNGRPQPRLADKWMWSPDRLTLRFRLHPNVRFHDGTIAAASRVATLLRKRLANHEMDSYADVADIQPESDGVVAIRLKHQNAFLLTDLVETSVRDKDVIGAETGPFRVVATKPTLRLAAFDEYYRGRPAIDFVEIRPYNTLRSAWAAMMRGDLDVLQEVRRDAVEFVAAESTVRTHSFLRPYYYPLVFNLRHPALRSKDVRTALSEAVDRQKIVDLAMADQGQVANGPIWPFHWAYSEVQRNVTYNPDAARLRLDAAGFPAPIERPGGRMPSRFQFKCLTVQSEQGYERILLYLQRQLAEVGVDMQLEPVSFQEFVKRVKTGQFDAFLMELNSGRTPSWSYTFWHSGGPWFNSGYDAADEVLDRLKRATTDDEIRAGVADLQRVMHDDPPAIFIAWPQTTRAVRTTFDVPSDQNPDIMGTLWRWKPAQPSLRASR
jgi:peptide/nickel transport system substrate-binding protein